ncbi:HAMP domain-containing histidine kinase [Naumannella sp. ID2617S]|nr:HAMP domain-containing histidine kinase [Naumannella sp. ID2617S]
MARTDQSRAPAPASAGPRRQRVWMSVRYRVLLAVTVLSLLAMTLAGVVAYALERQRVDNELDALLRMRLTETVSLTERGRSPVTGEPLADTRALLAAAVEQGLLQQHEGRMGLIGGRVVQIAPSAATVRPERNLEFVASLGGVPLDHATLDSFYEPRPGGSPIFRYLAVPVQMAGDPEPGLLVVAIDYRAEHQALDRNFRTYLFVAAGSLALVWFVAWLLIGQLLAPIALLRRTTREITDTDLSRRVPVQGHDDLALLTRTVNDMLDRLEQTFETQRSLYDDVGHELRTPLTILRGHLEVMDPTDPAEVRATRARGISEVDRMARLVEDLITLAKAERPDFIRLQSVDVGPLTDEVLEKARALGPRQWRLAEVADVAAELDPQRVSQALLELARNAVKFSPAGSEISIGSRQEGALVRLWVRDQGSGIDPDLVSRVQERFVRGGHQVDGSGLGLSIVAEIAASHRGSLEIQSVQGSGSTISLVLPVHPLPPVLQSGQEREETR